MAPCTVINQHWVDILQNLQSDWQFSVAQRAKQKCLSDILNCQSDCKFCIVCPLSGGLLCLKSPPFNIFNIFFYARELLVGEVFTLIIIIIIIQKVVDFFFGIFIYIIVHNLVVRKEFLVVHGVL